MELLNQSDVPVCPQSAREVLTHMPGIAPWLPRASLTASDGSVEALGVSQ